MTPETRKLYKTNAYYRSKTIRKARLDKSLTDQVFSHSYTIPDSVNIEDAYTFCSFTNKRTHEDCGVCQDCYILYCK